MAGVRNSKFVVAINHDASAAVFSQADVGVVDDWKVVLEALVTNIHGRLPITCCRMIRLLVLAWGLVGLIRRVKRRIRR